MNLTAVNSTNQGQQVATNEDRNRNTNLSNFEQLPLEIISIILHQTTPNGDFILSGKDLVNLTRASSICHCIVDLPRILARIEAAKVKAMQNALQNYQKTLPENHPDRSLIISSNGYEFQPVLLGWTFSQSVGYFQLQIPPPYFIK